MNKSKKLIIFGDGHFGKTAKIYFEKYTEYEVMGFISDLEGEKDEGVYGLQDIQLKFPTNKYDAFVAVGYSKMNTIREKYFLLLKKLGYRLATFIHPSVIWWDNSRIGENCFIFEHNTIQDGVEIGNNNIFWSGNHIGHGAKISENNWITSHVVVYSNVTIAENCFIGSNVNVKDSVVVGAFNFIGAGCNVWKDTVKNSFFPVQVSKPMVLSIDNIIGLV